MQHQSVPQTFPSEGHLASGKRKNTQSERDKKLWHIDLQVIYTNQVNVIGKQTRRDGVFRENPTKTSGSQREPIAESARALLKTGKKKTEIATAIQTKFCGESRTVKGNRPLPSQRKP